MTETIYCEKCGSEMNSFREGLSIGMLCPKCGWGWVTTNTNHILLDSQIYTVTIEGNLVPKINEIRFVSKYSGCNYIEAKKTLQQGAYVVPAKAIEIQKIARELTDAKIPFSINPHFPYQLFNGEYKNE